MLCPNGQASSNPSVKLKWTTCSDPTPNSLSSFEPDKYALPLPPAVLVLSIIPPFCIVLNEL